MRRRYCVGLFGLVIVFAVRGEANPRQMLGHAQLEFRTIAKPLLEVPCRTGREKTRTSRLIESGNAELECFAVSGARRAVRDVCSQRPAWFEDDGWRGGA